jgi:hypothetical protein
MQSSADGHFLSIMSQLFLESWQNNVNGDLASTAKGLYTSYNYILGMNMISNEIFDKRLTIQQILQPLEGTSLGMQPAESIGFFQLSKVWPAYIEPLQYAVNRANLSEVLFISGEFDPRTPLYMAQQVFNSILYKNDISSALRV